MIRPPPRPTLFPYTTLFRSPIDPQGPRSWMELLFLSVAVLSGVGLSDILPVTGMARALVMFESFAGVMYIARSEEHTSELQSLRHLVCRLLLEKKKKLNLVI